MECCSWEQTGYRSLRRRVNQGSWQDIPQLSYIPYISLIDVLHQAPRLLELVSPNGKRSLLAVCVSTRRLVLAFASCVSLQEDDTLQHLLDTPVGPCLHRLELHGIKLTATAVPELTSTPWSGLLKSLTLSNCGLNSSAISKLAAKNWPMLEHLSFSKNKLGKAAIKAMAGSKWPHLAYLDLSSNKLNASAITALTQLGWSRLAGLQLDNNPDLDSNAIRRLASGSWPFLKHLTISGAFALKDFVRLAASAWPCLESLYLDCDYCPPQTISFAGFGRNLQSLQIQTHYPSQLASFGMPAVLGLTQADWPNLRVLDLSSCNHLRSSGFLQLSFGQWPFLSELDVSHSQLSGEDFTPEVYFALGDWPQLTHLCLSHNGMNDECAAELTIADWPKLHTLDLSYNDIGATGSARLAQGDWPAMEHLCLHGNKPECICPCCTLQAGF